MQQTIYIPVWTKKYELNITRTNKVDPEDGEIIHITCPSIHLNQDYLLSDLSALLIDLPNMIESEVSQKADTHLHIRLKESEKILIEKKAHKMWYNSLSDFVRDQCLT